MIGTKTHGIFDYVGALLLIVAPYLFNFADIEVARNVFLSLGIGLAAYSLITRYYYSVAKVIPLGVHMTLDVLAGIGVMLSPHVFNYRDALSGAQYGFHFVLGLGVIGLVAFTKPKTESEVLPHSRFTTRAS